MVPPIVILAAAAISCSVVLLSWALIPRRSDARNLVATNLIRGQVNDLRRLALAAPTRERTLQPLVAALSRAVRRITPAGSLVALERKLALAGLPPSWPLERVLAAKIVLALLGVALLLSRIMAGSGASPILLVVLTLLLYFTPDVYFSARAKERQRAIVRDLPDTLDQITICMEAGLGFESSLARASQGNDRPLARELGRMLQEIQVGVGRRQALRGLAERNDVPDLRHFVTATLQAETYGVPVARVLHTHAAELRTKRRQRAEEAARKLPLKLLIPLVLFVMPPLFIILVGPAALRLMEAFSAVD
jgi:tight adherence protein C